MRRPEAVKATCEYVDSDGNVCGLPAEEGCVLVCCVGLPTALWFVPRGLRMREVTERLLRGVSKEDTRTQADKRRDLAVTLKAEVGVPVGARPGWCASRVSSAPDRTCCRLPGKSLVHDQPDPTCRRRICHRHHPVKGMDPHYFKDHKLVNDSYGCVCVCVHFAVVACSRPPSPPLCAGCQRTEGFLKAT
jgi:hypothetical protein